MGARRIFHVTSSHLTVYRWSGAAVRQEAVFESGPQGLSGFSDHLAREPHSISYMLTDIIEEEYHNETLPHVVGRDRRALLERKTNQLFRHTPYHVTQRQGRERSGRRDDRVLFTALTNPDILTPWLDCLTPYKVPLAGIYSLPMLGAQLLKKLRFSSPGTLLLTRQRGGMLRQTFFNGHDLKISRLSPVTTACDEEYISLLLHEVQKNQRYLNRLRLLPQGSELDVVVVDQGSRMEKVQAGCKDTGLQRYHFFEASEVARIIGLKDTLGDDECERLFVHLLCRKTPESNYALSPQRRYYRMQRARMGLIVTSAVLALGGSGWSMANIIGAADLVKQAASATIEAQQLMRDDRQARRKLPETPASARRMQLAVGISDTLSRYKTSPRPMMISISRALASHPHIRVDEIQWSGATHPDALPQGDATTTEGGDDDEGDGGQLYQIAVLTGIINPFDGDFQAAFDEVEGFMRTLRRDPSRPTVQPLAMPLNVDPASTLSGEAGTKLNIPSALFKIKIVTRIDRNDTA